MPLHSDPLVHPACSHQSAATSLTRFSSCRDQTELLERQLPASARFLLTWTNLTAVVQEPNTVIVAQVPCCSFSVLMVVCCSAVLSRLHPAMEAFHSSGSSSTIRESRACGLLPAISLPVRTMTGRPTSS